jgi:hypothetical protein
MSIVEYEYNRFELFIIWKLVYHRWWCEKHLSRRDTVKGAPEGRYGDAAAAIDSLVRKQLVRSVKKQGREDICVPKQLKNYFEHLLIEYQNKDGYGFIRGMDFIR